MASNVETAKTIIENLLALPDLYESDRQTVAAWKSSIEKCGSYAQVTADHLLRLKTVGQEYGLFPPDASGDSTPTQCTAHHGPTSWKPSESLTGYCFDSTRCRQTIGDMR
jgi:hypothetical protein